MMDTNLCWDLALKDFIASEKTRQEYINNLSNIKKIKNVMGVIQMTHNFGFFLLP